MEKDTWLSVKELAAELRFHPNTVRRHLRDKKSFVVVKVGRAYRIQLAGNPPRARRRIRD